MLKELLQPEIEDLIEEKEWEALRDILPLWQEVETANLITSLKNEDKYKVFSVLPKDYNFEMHKKLVPMQPGDVPVTYADTTPLEEDFGFKPSTSLREGLREFAEWYAEYYGL